MEGPHEHALRAVGIMLGGMVHNLLDMEGGGRQQQEPQRGRWGDVQHGEGLLGRAQPRQGGGRAERAGRGDVEGAEWAPGAGAAVP